MEQNNQPNCPCAPCAGRCEATRYDFTEAEKWLSCYPAKEMAETLKEEALNLVNMGLEKEDGIDPKERVLRMMEAVNFVCGFLDTIKATEVKPC